MQLTAPTAQLSDTGELREFAPEPSERGSDIAFDATGQRERASRRLLRQAPVRQSRVLARANARDSRIRLKVQAQLLQEIDLTVLRSMQDTAHANHLLEKAVGIILDEVEPLLTTEERTTLLTEILNEISGLGPLEPLFDDPEINDILVNGPDSVWVERRGRLEQTDVTFRDDEHLLHVINRIVAPIGRHVDESSPMVDARLSDGSRVNAVVPPLAQDGAVLSIRRFNARQFTLADLVELETLSESAAEFLQLAVFARLNILVSGGTSAGKTTLLNVLSGCISNTERIVTIEDTAELRLQQAHVIRMESRPDNAEGRGTISQRALVKNSLRMRPDRIIIGEVRGPEALDMLQAMNTGHDGSLTTLHANSARDALSRLETMVLLSGINLSQGSIREQIAAAFHVIVQIKRLPDGSRRVTGISEVLGIDGTTIMLSDLFKYELKTANLDRDGLRSGFPPDSDLQTSRTPEGKLLPTGNVTVNSHRFEDAGVICPPRLFVRGV